MLFTQGRCVNEPLYMFTCMGLLLAVGDSLSRKIEEDSARRVQLAWLGWFLR